jgi:c-di-GMP-binding flagellar brake protein YcgR
LGAGRFAVQLEKPSQIPMLRVGQQLTIGYVRPGEAKYMGITSVWSIDAEHSIAVLTPPETTGRRQDRRFVRVSHSVRVRVTVFDQDNLAVWSGTTKAKDLSAGGLCLGLPANLAVGTKLNCCFEVPGRSSKLTVYTPAVVVRNCDQTYGVQFVGLAAAVERQLVAAVSWLQLSPRVGV